MMHAVVLLLIALVVGKLAALIPMATLAGILTAVAYYMSEWRNLRAQLRAPRADVLVLVLFRRSYKEGTTLLIAGLQAQPRTALERAGVLEEIGDGHVFMTVDEAISAATAELANQTQYSTTLTPK